MSIGNLRDEADLKRWLENQLQTPGVAPKAPLPFQNIRFGSDSLDFEEGTLSEPTTITHGLGKVPLSVVATALQAPGPEEIPNCNAFNWTDQTFDVNGETFSPIDGSVSFSWMAAV
jgi:hypothetical protein